MRLKYYLRGLGIGILVTTVILMIAFARSDRSMSDAEVMERARELGMVMEDERTPADQKLQGTEADPVSTEGTGAPDETGQSGVPDDTGNPDGTDVPGGTGAPGGTDTLDTQNGAEGGNTVTQQELTVEVGDSSNMVAQKLAQLGLVDNAEAFNQYMMDNGYASGVLPGTILIPQGASYEEIAQMLVDKELQR